MKIIINNFPRHFSIDLSKTQNFKFEFKISVKKRFLGHFKKNQLIKIPTPPNCNETIAQNRA